MNGTEFLRRIETELNQCEAERKHLEGMREHAKQVLFWRWKVQVMVRVLEHDAMREHAMPVYAFDLDSPLLREWFEAGETVEQVVARAHETFELAGWDDWEPHNWHGYGAAVDPVAVGQSIPRGGPDCGGGDMLRPGDAGDCW